MTVHLCKAANSVKSSDQNINIIYTQPANRIIHLLELFTTSIRRKDITLEKSLLGL